MSSTESEIRHSRRRGSFVATAGLVAALALTACDGFLDVDDPDVVTPDQLEGPEAVPTAVAGMVRSFQEGWDDYVRYSTMFTDEMILAGTFQGRVEVDDRRITPENVQVTGELYEPVQRARETAEDLIQTFEANLEDPDFSDVRGEMEAGIVRGNLFAGFMHVVLAEMYCGAVVDPEGPPLSPGEVMDEALAFLEEAEARADELGLTEVAQAARVGQARAHLWRGELGEAATLVDGIPDAFTHVVEYSDNVPEQNHELAAETWGFSTDIRWTVGDGTSTERREEIWAYFDEWLEQGLLDPDTDLDPQNVSIPVTLQLFLDDPAAPGLLASGWEARMIEAEVELRNGNPGDAEAIVNDLLEEEGQARNPMTLLDSGPDELGAFESVDFTGDLAEDLPQLARARSAGLWLSGGRQATLRRFVENDGVNLYPDRGGDDVCFPIPQQEIDNNPNL